MLRAVASACEPGSRAPALSCAQRQRAAMASDDEASAALEKVLGVASTAVDRGLQAVADIYIKDDWSPEVMVKKTQYTMDKHEQIVRSALQRAADALVDLWVADQQQLQVCADLRHSAPNVAAAAADCAFAQATEDEQLANLEESLEKERARQAAARERAALAERLRAEAAEAEAQLRLEAQAAKDVQRQQRQAELARAAAEAELDAELDAMEEAIRSQHAQKLVEARDQHLAEVRAAETEMEELRMTAQQVAAREAEDQAVLKGRSEAELEAKIAAVRAEADAIEALLNSESEESKARIEALRSAAAKEVAAADEQAGRLRAEQAEAQRKFEEEEARIGQQLAGIKSEEIDAEKREFFRQLNREKRRATYLEAAKVSRPDDLAAAKAAAQRRMRDVAARGAMAQAVRAVAASGAGAAGGSRGFHDGKNVRTESLDPFFQTVRVVQSNNG